MLKYIGAIFLTIVTFTLGFYTKDWTSPEPKQPPPDTVYKQTSEPDTSMDLWLPEVVVLHDTITETRTDTFIVPLDMNVGGIVSKNPIRRDKNFFGSDDLVFTKFDPSERRYIQNRYSLDPPEWSLWPRITLRSTPIGFELIGTVNFRYKTLILEGGASVWRDDLGPTIGITWRPFKIP